MKYVFPKFTKIVYYIKGKGKSIIKSMRLLCQVKMRVFLENLRKKYPDCEARVLFYKIP